MGYSEYVPSEFDSTKDKCHVECVIQRGFTFSLFFFFQRPYEMSTKEVYSVSMSLTNSTFFAEFDLIFFNWSLLFLAHSCARMRKQSMSIVRVQCRLEVVDRRRKLWTVDGSEGVLTTPPCFGLTKVQINFDVATLSKCKE